MHTETAFLSEAHIISLKEIEANYWWFEGRIDWATRLINMIGNDHGTYADVGCGTGGLAKRINRRFNFEKTYLIDGDDSITDVPPYENYQFLKQDLSQGLTLPTQANVITCMDVIEHLPEDEKTLRSIYSQLKDGGTLILSVPAVPWFYSDWDKKLGHHRRYLKGNLCKKLKRCGFNVVRAKYMWSFLSPLAPIRKYFGKSEGFPKTSPFMNSTFKNLSKLEWHLSEFTPAPLGTSLIIGATKR